MLSDGKPERALELFAAAWKESPGHGGVLKDFPIALAGLKKSGDEAFQRGRYEEAGKRWASSLRHAGHPAAKGRTLSFSGAELKADIDRASGALMEKAVVAYRNGDLEGAIASWRAVLSYDSSNEEAARSLQTATTQLENLKRIPPATK
jgi:tetratricopeptide (TPR) repeat protein